MILLLVVVVVILVAVLVSGWNPTPAAVIPGGSHTVSLDAQLDTNASHTAGTAMATLSVQVPQGGFLYSLQGNVVVSKMGLPGLGVAQGLFSYWISPAPFPNPLPMYSAAPPGATKVTSVIVNDWLITANQAVQIQTGGIVISSGYYLAVIVDLTGGMALHGESQVTAVTN